MRQTPETMKFFFRFLPMLRSFVVTFWDRSLALLWAELIKALAYDIATADSVEAVCS